MRMDSDNNSKLVIKEDNAVYRITDYGYGEIVEEWIGQLNFGNTDNWFYAYGDNRTFTPNELRQLLEMLEKNK